MGKEEKNLINMSNDDYTEFVYKMKECMDYAEVGSLSKDLARVIKPLKFERNKVFTNGSDNPKVGTLIGKNVFFEALSNEIIIKNIPELNKIYLDKTVKGNEEVYRYTDFICVKNSAGKIYIQYTGE